MYLTDLTTVLSVHLINMKARWKISCKLVFTMKILLLLFWVPKNQSLKNWRKTFVFLNLLFLSDRTLPGKMFLPRFSNEISLISLLLIFSEVTLAQNLLAVGERFQRRNTCLIGAEQNRDIQILFTQRNMGPALLNISKGSSPCASWNKFN